jgi:hypothetical protein
LKGASNSYQIKNQCTLWVELIESHEIGCSLEHQSCPWCIIAQGVTKNVRLRKQIAMQAYRIHCTALHIEGNTIVIMMIMMMVGHRWTNYIMQAMRVMRCCHDELDG